MAVFVDGAGREWRVAINVALLDRVKGATDVRVERLIRDEMRGLIELLDDPGTLARVLWELVRDQRTDVTLMQFGEQLAGDALEGAAKAFIEALASFSPSRPRLLLREMAATYEEVAERETNKALEALREIRQTPSASATNSPASSESIPEG